MSEIGYLAEKQVSEECKSRVGYCSNQTDNPIFLIEVSTNQ